MQSVRTGAPTPITPTGSRMLVGRRLRAARLLADVSLRDADCSAGLSYLHVSAIERGREPMTTTDARDLGAVLGCPPAWLTSGWTDTTTYAPS